MSLETATYINQLNAINPLGSDPISAGDDHIRLIKSAIKATFPNVTGPVTLTQDQLNTPVPSGGVILWTGAKTAIPTGWYLCDGTNGTPNLQDKFVVGAGNSYAVGATGGNASVTLSSSQIPGHTHSFSATTGTESATHNHGITISDPGHVHGIYTGGSNGSGPGFTAQDTDTGTRQTAGATTGITASSGTQSANHTHSVSGTTGSTGSGSAIDIRNPYYALCYIMKA
jgi:microcystin-dependent protein